MNSNRLSGVLRAGGGIMLLALLAVCGFMGAGREETAAVSVPIVVETISAQALSRVSAEQTREKLRTQREAEIALLSSVIEHAASPEETIRSALEQKTQIALRMEQEAQTEAALSYMGFDGAAVVSGAQSMTVFAPYEYVSDERSRIQIIDCVCMQTGISPEDVKIILAKNE